MRYLAHAERVAEWSVYALFALVPFFFVPVPWVTALQSKSLLLVVVTVCFLAWVASALNASTLRFPKSPLLIAAALIPLAYLISALATGASWESFAGDGTGRDTVIGFVLLYLAFLVSAGVLSGSGTTPALRLFFLGSLVVVVVQTIHLALPSFTFGGVLPIPASSIVGSWHDLGIFLALVVGATLSLRHTTVLQGYWNILAVVGALVAFLLLVIINFGDVWLGLFGLALFCAFFSYRTRGVEVPRRSNDLVVPLVCAGIALGMYFGGNMVQSVLPTPLQVVQVEVRPSWQGTFAIGQGVFAEPARIFFGSGPNTFLREWDVHKPLGVNETDFWNTDFYYGVGFIPTSLVTTGLLGVLAWGAVCAALLWGLYRMFRDPSSGGVRMTLMGSALFLTVFHVLYVPGPALSLMTFLLFGALVAEEVSKDVVREWVASLSWGAWRGRVLAAALIAASVAVFVGSVQAVRVLVSDVFVNRAVVTYNTTQDTAKASRSISSALGVLPNNDRAHRAGVELGLLKLLELISSQNASDAGRIELQATLSATIEHGLAAVSIESEDYQNWLSLARLYGELAGAGVEGAEEKAREAYREAQKNNPTSPLPFLGEAQLDTAKGDDAAAKKGLEVALTLKPNLAIAHFLLSQAQARAGAFDSAQEHAVATVQIAPQDPLGWYNLGTILYASEAYQDAAFSFERAVALQDNYANALFLLGASYYKLERTSDALAALKAVAALNPDDATLKEIIPQIEVGKDPGPLFQ